MLTARSFLFVFIAIHNIINYVYNRRHHAKNYKPPTISDKKILFKNIATTSQWHKYKKIL